MLLDGGGWMKSPGGKEHEARGFLSMAERLTSSTYRELIGIREVLKSLARFVCGSSVRLFTDSWCAWRILTVGSGKLYLHRLSIEIFWFCHQHGIRLEVTWIPREGNVRADYLAGIYDRDDWSLAGYWFRCCEMRWGTHTIDRFATHLNCVVTTGRFNSRWWCPGCEDIDCLSLLNWAFENNWCNPPFGLIGRLIRLLRRLRAKATIIIPVWTGRHWWPLLCPDGVNWASFVVDWFVIPREAIEGVHVFSPGAGMANEGFVGPPSFEVRALRVDFSLG